MYIIWNKKEILMPAPRLIVIEILYIINSENGTTSLSAGIYPGLQLWTVLLMHKWSEGTLHNMNVILYYLYQRGPMARQ